jgi:hypothetical protein
MSLLDRIKTRTGSDLPDSELQAMIDAIMAEVAVRLGPLGVGSGGVTTVELGDPVDPDSRANRTLRLALPIDVARSVTVTELDPGNSGAALCERLLDPADYRVMHGGRTLQRLTGGPNGAACWAPLVRVAYTPLGADSAAAAAEEAAIKLVTLDLSYRGMIKSEKAGDYQWQASLASDSYAVERENILAALVAPAGLVLA